MFGCLLYFLTTVLSEMLGVRHSWLPFLPILAAYAGVLLFPSSVAVHDDGVRITSFGRTRFVPFRIIVTVERVERKAPFWMRGNDCYLGVKFRTTHGEFEVGTGSVDRGWGSQRIKSPQDLENERLLHAFEESFGRFRAHEGHREPVADHLIRRERSVAEWLGYLKEVARSEVYRGVAATSEQLWKVIEDPSVLPSARAGAAVALRPSLNEEGKVRLRIASDSSGSRALRVAIAKVAEESSDDELIDALSQIED